MSQIRLVVFDIAGTTVKDQGHVARCFIEAFREFNLQFTEAEVNPLMGYDKKVAIRSMLDKAGREADAGLVDRIYLVFREKMIGFYDRQESIEALPHAADLFGQLKQMGIARALNTGFHQAITNAILNRLGWLRDGLIDTVISSDEVEQARPAPLMIRELMKRCGITDPAQVAKIGDTEVDILEGRNAGCGLVVGITTGACSRPALEALAPDFVIDDLAGFIDLLKD